MPARPRLLIDDQIPERDRFAEIADVRPFVASELDRALTKQADALIVRSVSRVDATLLQNTPIRFVGTATSGIDHIDTNYLALAGIRFAHAKGANAPSVAQYVLAAIGIYCKLKKSTPAGLSIGIVGFGHVGALVGQIARGLDMNVLASDPPLESAGIAGPWVGLDELLSKSDVVTLHVPLTRAGPHATIGLIAGEQLQRLKAGAGLIQTSRGGVVNEGALHEALANNQGEICAFVDVWEREPEIDIELAKLCTVATPHIAGYSIESKRRASIMLCDAMREFREWSEPKNSQHPHLWVADPARPSYQLVGRSELDGESFLARAHKSFPLLHLSADFLRRSGAVGAQSAFENIRQANRTRSEASPK